MKHIVTCIITAAVLAACNNTGKQPEKTTGSAAAVIKDTTPLREKMAAVAARSGGVVGIAVTNLDTRDTFTLNNEPVYPMQSVFKFPIAMAILHLIDGGKLAPEQKIFIGKNKMVKNTYSPLRDSFPAGNVEQTIAQLLQYSVSKSDNIACDLLIELAGGEAAVNDYIHSLGVQQISIVASEAKMHANWNTQYKNWCAPSALVQLLDIMNQGKALSKTSNDFLWKLMLETTTGKKRLKALLPAGTEVAHKTGLSDTKDGLTAATNDVGIILLPNGQKLAVAVFVMNSKANEAVREATIAEVAKLAYDHAL